MRIEKLELNDTEKFLLYHDCDLTDEDISVINKYIELYYAAVMSLVYKA
jgi:hypothetical protein